MPFKSRHTEDLLKGRVSVPGALYFLTWVTDRRTPLFVDDSNRDFARQKVAAIDDSADGTIMAGTIMPDHIHLLLELGPRLTVSQLVAKSKAAITRNRPDVKWQLNFFEHRLRRGESSEPYAFYIFMNPYVAGLCPLDLTWAGWVPSLKVRWEFEEKLRKGALPQPEWVEEARRFSNTLPPGAD